MSISAIYLSLFLPNLQSQSCGVEYLLQLDGVPLFHRVGGEEVAGGVEFVFRAGERALDSLREAKEQLNSARNWGIYDMIGGGLISSMIKHSKIDRANEWMDQANRDLRCFAKELRDVDSDDLQIDTGSLVSMLDIF